jgi:holin-like protein
MIASLSLILLCQLVGEIFVHSFAVPVPGPVVGMMLLLILLLLRDRIPRLARGPLHGNGVEARAKGLLAHLSLLFVPAGVGIVQKLDLLAEHGLAIAASRDLRCCHFASDGCDVFARRPVHGWQPARGMNLNPFSLWVYLSQTPLLWSL